MNCVKSLLPLVGLVALCFLGPVAGDGESAKPKEIYTNGLEGYDNHMDSFYYAAGAPDAENVRSKLQTDRKILGGPISGSCVEHVKEATHPFLVVQRSLTNLRPGPNMNRWDVKDYHLVTRNKVPAKEPEADGNEADGNGAAKDKAEEPQYFAVYHGKKNTFVVNMLRAELLRRVANAVNGDLNLLDSKPNTRLNEEDIAGLQARIADIITSTFRKVDEDIKKSLSEPSWSTASIVIVTKKYVITASVGKGKVVGYDSKFQSKIVDVAGEQKDNDNVFGSRTDVTVPITPKINFYDRASYYFLIIENPSVANMGIDNAIVQYVRDKIKSCHMKCEETMLRECGSGIMQSVKDNLGMFDKLKHTDYMIMLIALNKKYESYH